MSDRTAIERRKQVTEEAAAWLVRLNDNASQAERGEFIDWLRESPLHVAEMLRMGSLHDLLTEFDGWSTVHADHKVEPGPDNVIPLPRRERASHPAPLQTVRRWPMALAASLVAMLIVSGVWLRDRQNHIQTQHAERRELKLADGSLVELAPNTELHLRFRKAERLVMLDRGEAVFHVAKNAARPFVVEADHTRVRAVGTAFSVGHVNGAIVVTVAEGKVAVQQSANSLRQGGKGAAQAVPIALVANEQVVVNTTGATPVRTVNGRAELAWAHGLLIFNNDSIGEVVRRFNLANRVQIRITDPALEQRTISGVFDASDPASFINFLENVAGASAWQNGNDEIIVSVQDDHAARDAVSGTGQGTLAGR